MRIEIDPVIEEILDKALWGKEIKRHEACELMKVKGEEFYALCMASDMLRRRTVGDCVTFVVNRNINFTDICMGSCSFCNFRNRRRYLLSIEEILEKAKTPGITEVCIQGGLHPDLNLDFYTEMLRAIKRERPDIHIHAFSPAEINHMKEKSGLSIKEVLTALKEHGLDSMPGTAAEILNDKIRKEICPEKIRTEEWVDIIKTAHRLGIPTTATIMYGHIESEKDRINHIFLIKEIQKETEGFTEFIPLTFMSQNRLGISRGIQGATGIEDVKMYAVSRIILNNHIKNLQVSWVKLGRKFAQVMLMFGANDLGGTLMEESISKASGGRYGERIQSKELISLIRNMGRIPVQRDTLYNKIKEFPPTSQGMPQ